MDLRQLKIFCLLAEKLSFSKVAEQLYVTQPTISFQIKLLEKEIGARLFERDTKNLRLSPEGKLLYAYAGKMLDLGKLLKEEIDDLRGFKKGELCIGASNIPGIYILPDIFGKFRKEFPGIRIDLKIMDSRQIFDAVTETKIDLGMVGNIINEGHLRFEKFIEDELMLIVSGKHPWAKRKFIDIGEIKLEPFILREEGSGTREVLKRSLLTKKIEFKDLNVIMQLSNNEAIKKAVEAGLGVSFVSGFSIKNEEKLHILKRVPVKGFSILRYFYVVSNTSRLSACSGVFRLFLARYAAVT